MLKLEKKSQNRPVSVSFRMGGGLFTPTFVRALTLAIGLHLSGFLLFQVCPFKIGNVETIFPPTQVNIDMAPPLEGTVLARPEGGAAASKSIMGPKPSTPAFPTILELISERDLAYPKAHLLTRFPFHMIETPISPNLTTNASKKENRIEVHAYKDLADKKLLHKGWKGKDLLAHCPKGEYLAAFDVRVEDRTGKIFWYEMEQDPEKKKLRVLAEDIIQKLQFARNPKGGVSLGRVEIIFTRSEQND